MAQLTNAAVAIGTAFFLSLTIAISYTRLRRDAVYQRTFVEALAVAGVVASVVVLSIGDNIARGIGLVGAVTLVRFRSNLKDPLDLIFVFAALGAGVASGALALPVAILGTAVFLIGVFAVSRSMFTRGADYDAIVTLRASTDEATVEAITRELRERCRQFALLRVRPTAAGYEHAYRIVLGEPASRIALVHALERIRGVGEPEVVLYDRSHD